MLDEKKIRLMTELARYEQGAGEKELRIVKHYRSDYIILGLLKNFFFTTIGYLLLWGVIIAANMDYLLENLHKVRLSVVAVEFIGGYLVFLTIYSFITYVRRYKQYERAKRNAQQYYAGLNRLSSRYYGDRSDRKKPAGGKTDDSVI